MESKTTEEIFDEYDSGLNDKELNSLRKRKWVALEDVEEMRKELNE